MPVQNAVLSRDHPMPDEQPPAADDLPALRLLVLPDLGPPFDDDPAAAAIVAAGAGVTAIARPPRPPRTQQPSRTRQPPCPPRTPVRGPRRRGPTVTGRGSSRCCFARRWLAPGRFGRSCPGRPNARLKLDRLRPLFAGGQRPRMLRVITTQPTRDVIE